jgi:16S rRNA A1518/A1519 N6-dimethyltransferase RsmA/KsgA/DIM1 with predicted DNA glycosylase/AP lyase activity
VKIESIQEVANETYAAFQQKIGSNQIATRQALRVIGKELCLMEKPNILEFGAGIGTITFLY